MGMEVRRSAGVAVAILGMSDVGAAGGLQTKRCMQKAAKRDRVKTRFTSQLKSAATKRVNRSERRGEVIPEAIRPPSVFLEKEQSLLIWFVCTAYCMNGASSASAVIGVGD